MPWEIWRAIFVVSGAFLFNGFVFSYLAWRCGAFGDPNDPLRRYMYGEKEK